MELMDKLTEAKATANFLRDAATSILESRDGLAEESILGFYIILSDLMHRIDRCIIVASSPS